MLIDTLKEGTFPPIFIFPNVMILDVEMKINFLVIFFDKISERKNH